MMSKTHLSVGVATSLILLQPDTITKCVIAVAGGALGGAIPDIDAVSSESKHDAVIAQVIAVALAGVMMLIDRFTSLNITDYILAHAARAIFGIMLFFLLVSLGYMSAHRTFTHSLLGAILFTSAFELIYPKMALAFSIGYVSHIALDLLNRRKIQVFYPLKKGFCFKLCYAAKTANKAFGFAGLGVSVAMLIISAVRIAQNMK